VFALVSSVTFACTLFIVVTKSSLTNGDNSLMFERSSQLLSVPAAHERIEVPPHIAHFEAAHNPVQMKPQNQAEKLESNSFDTSFDLSDSTKWSTAMREVQRKVLNQIRAQQKEREESAKKIAEESYRNKLYSSLSRESRRTVHLASRERAARLQDQLQSMEDAENSEMHSDKLQRNTQARESEISSERLAEESDAARRLQSYARVGSEGLHSWSDGIESGDGMITSYSPAAGSWLNTKT